MYIVQIINKFEIFGRLWYNKDISEVEKMSEVENNLIEKVKILILYGNKSVDGKIKDGKVERIFKDDDDTAHYFYIKEFLQSHMKDEEELQQVLKEKNDVNSVFYEIQKLGHIVFAENSSTPDYKSGIFYMPKEISDKQKKVLKTLQGQLEKEDYNLLAFMNLHRDKEGILTGKQKHGSAKVLDEFVKEEEQR